MIRLLLVYFGQALRRGPYLRKVRPDEGHAQDRE